MLVTEANNSDSTGDLENEGQYGRRSAPQKDNEEITWTEHRVIEI